MILQQLSVFLENRAGQLAEITGILSECDINLRALNIAETADYGVLRMIASEPLRAAEVLREHGMLVTLTPVVAAAVPDRPGGLGELLEVLARENIDISYMYSIFGHRNGMAHMIFRVNQPEELCSILQRNGLQAASAEELGVH